MPIIGVTNSIERRTPPPEARASAIGFSKRQNARKRDRTLEFCTICTKAARIGAAYRYEIPCLINKICLYVDYLRLIRLVEPRRWYVSYKIRVRRNETVHYGRAT